MASAEKKIEREDSPLRKILRVTWRVIAPILAVSAILYISRAAILAGKGRNIAQGDLSMKTYFEDGGDGYLYLGESQAKVDRKNIVAAGSYTFKEGTIRITDVGGSVYSFRALSTSAILSLDWDTQFLERMQ